MKKTILKAFVLSLSLSAVPVFADTSPDGLITAKAKLALVKNAAPGSTPTGPQSEQSLLRTRSRARPETGRPMSRFPARRSHGRGRGNPASVPKCLCPIESCRGFRPASPSAQVGTRAANAVVRSYVRLITNRRDRCFRRRAACHR